jgi:hypothetical protein
MAFMVYDMILPIIDDDLSRSNLLHLRPGNSLGCSEGLDKMEIWLTRNLEMPLDFVTCVLE